MKPNPGHCPPEASGKRVRVRLVRTPPGKISFECPADGRGAPNWALSPADDPVHPFDIAEYEVIP